jgi:acetyl esterase/lipase
MPAQLEDCKSAVRWLRAHADEYHLDGSHIAAWGHSAGGHLASMLGVTSGIRGFDVGENLDRSSAVQAVIDWSGPTDILAMAGKSEKSLTDPNDTLAKLVGGPIRGHEDQAKAASPITYVRPGVPPFLIAHSDADPIVPFSQAEELRDALQKAKVEVVWRPLHGVPHWDKALVSREMFDASLAFLDRNLKGTGPTTAPSPSGSNAGRLPKNS